MKKSVFGVIGLGVMGSSLSLNIADRGHKISVYNRNTIGEENVVPSFLDRVNTDTEVEGFVDLKEFVASIEQPRRILIMIKAGNAIDQVIDTLLPLLSQDDIIIDGGNSYYKDTKRRIDYLQKHQLYFIGCGISGGEEGARKGPSMMVGGSKKAYAQVAKVLESIAARDKHGNSCCAYVGEEGAGHFVKMIHNGIEYVEMQLLAELYGLLSKTKTNEEIASLFSRWNGSDLSSYLLDITISILKTKEDGDSVLDMILDKAGNKGTGSWSTKVALDLGTVNTMMSSAVFARYISSFKEERKELSKTIEANRYDKSPDLEMLEKAYRFARVINHQQGFRIIKEGYSQYGWELNASEIARIWTNGCIIRSEFMEASVELLKTHKDFFNDKNVLRNLASGEENIQVLLQEGLLNRIPLDAFYNAYNYWISMTSEKLSANLIQAQRDYFGAHTYQRIDASEDKFFHTNWTSK